MAAEPLHRSQNETLVSSPAVLALQKQLAQVQASTLAAADSDVAKAALPTAAGEQYLVFLLQECEFVIKAEMVQGVERIIDLTPVPNVAPWVKGVMNLRGAITSVVDLRLFLDLEQIAYSPRTRLLSVHYNDMVISFIVDGVNEMLPVPASAIVPAEASVGIDGRRTSFVGRGGSQGPNALQSAIPQWIASYARGSVLLGSRLLVLLDVERLLFSEKIQHYEVQ